MDERKNIRLEEYDYSKVGSYFITICTLNKEPMFWKDPCAMITHPQDVELSPYGEIVDAAVKNISDVYPSVIVRKYVIMPNHIHMIIKLKSKDCPERPSISRVIAQMKGVVTKTLGRQIWQKLFYDHVIRNRDDYLECARYIHHNPMRWSNKYAKRKQ